MGKLKVNKKRNIEHTSGCCCYFFSCFKIHIVVDTDYGTILLRETKSQKKKRKETQEKYE
jgi:hypothetical protein